MYGFVLGPHQFQSTSQNTHLTSKTVIIGCAGFQEKFDTPPLKTETSYRKLNSLPTKLHMLFPTHLQARELRPQTYSLSLPLECNQVGHTPTNIKSGGAYKPALYSTFARQLSDDTRLPGWLSACPVHSQAFKPTQASFAHTNSQPSHSTSYKIFLVFFFFFFFFFLSVGGFLQSSTQPHESANRPLQRATGHIKGTCPPLLIPVAAMGKCKQANEFQSRHYGHLTSLVIHEQNRPDSQFKVVLS